MQTILKDLEMLGGVHHGCLIAHEGVMASTFPSMLNNNLVALNKVLLQIFAGAQALEREHREIQIELEENLLLGFWLESGAILALLTEKNVNLALIKTSVRSASVALSQAAMAEIPRAAQLEPEAGVAATVSVPEPASAAACQNHIDAAQSLLADYIGPAARIVSGRALKQWQDSGSGTAQELPRLMEMLAAFIDNETKRADFLRRALQQITA